MGTVTSYRILLIAVFLALIVVVKSSLIHIPLNNITQLKRDKRNVVLCDSEDSHRCRDGNCIQQYNVCDGLKDCPDGSDEVQSACLSGGSKVHCPSRAFQCAYGACIDGNKVCDGVNDCADNSDEELLKCPAFKWLRDGVSNKCESGEFQCRNGECINQEYVCDGTKHCKDGSDETVTHCHNIYCSVRAFRCAYGGCINFSEKCNNVIDCADGSDEDDVLCKREVPSVSSKPVPETTTEKWTPSTLYQHDCERPSPEPGTQYKDVNKNLIKLTCNEDYTLKESQPYIHCTLGAWHPTTSRCVRKCPKFTSISADFQYIYKNKILSDDEMTVLPGTKAKITCKNYYYDSFNLLDNECFENGSWKYPYYKCTKVCGVIEHVVDNKPAIAHGITTRPSQVPWNVAIFYKDDKTNEFTNICGGSLLSAYIVLTAAHCIVLDASAHVFRSAYKLEVAGGKFHREYNETDEDERRLKVANLYAHQSYSGPYFFRYDIGLIELEGHFHFSLTIKCINSVFVVSSPQIGSGAEGYVAGWGRDETNKGTKELKSLVVPYVPRDECLKIVTTDKDIVPKEKFCGRVENGATVKEGDSGAGLAFKLFNNQYFVVGVVSTTTQNYSYSVFTDIMHPEITDFLKANIDEIDKRRDK